MGRKNNFLLYCFYLKLLFQTAPAVSKIWHIWVKVIGNNIWMEHQILLQQKWQEEGQIM